MSQTLWKILLLCLAILAGLEDSLVLSREFNPWRPTRDIEDVSSAGNGTIEVQSSSQGDISSREQRDELSGQDGVEPAGPRNEPAGFSRKEPRVLSIFSIVSFSNYACQGRDEG